MAASERVSEERLALIERAYGGAPDGTLAATCVALAAELLALRAERDRMRAVARYRIDPAMERAIRYAVASVPSEFGPEHERWVTALLAEIDALRARHAVDPDGLDREAAARVQRAIDTDDYVGALHRVTDAHISAMATRLARMRAVIDAPPNRPEVADALARVSEGACLIAAERRRQVEYEGWSAEHDDEHDRGDLAIVAAMLAVHGTDAEVRAPEDMWMMLDNPRDPWGLIAKHGCDPIRALAIAGALIAAEIDRLIRRASRNAREEER